MRIAAAQGLALELDEGRPWRVGWGESDWLGPVTFAVRHAGERWSGAEPAAPGAKALAVTLRPFRGEDDLGSFRGVELVWEPLPLALRTSVRAYTREPVLVFRTEAADDLAGLATGSFGEPSVVWPWLRPALRQPGGVAPGTRSFGHQFTEFAFPTFGGAEADDFLLFPHRPAVVEPLAWLTPDGRCVLLAPLDAFHEQVIAVPAGRERAAEGVRCGWQGDLDQVPRGFATELALWAGPGPRRVLDSWAGRLRHRHRTRRPSRYADASVARLSYWTDNGAAYWYRTEPDLDLSTSLERTLAGLREHEVPVAAVELDSWFYPHEKTRPVGPGEPGHVPPTGLLRWEPRPDVLPEGVHGLRRRLGDAPLILHGRHISSRSPYRHRHAMWVDGERAHPQGPELLQDWMAQAASWGAVAYEQDWLVESFLGVRGLRERPGRARDWQQALDRAAGEHGLSLIWCMATPADFLATLDLERVVAIRTGGDYRYLADNPAHWVRFLLTNALARALGLLPFKDVFLSQREGRGWEGDPHAEAEALLAALSAGPVGIGDRLGRTDRALVLRTCRADGLLVKPDVPIAALERCFQRDAFFEPEPLIGETYSTHPAGRWVYLASFNAWRGGETLRFRLPLADLGELCPAGPVVGYDWRRDAHERLAPEDALELSLAPGDWDLRVLCPLLPGELAVFGDVSRYASVGDRRLRGIRVGAAGTVDLDVLGAPDELVEIRGWAARPLAEVARLDDGVARALPRGEALPGWTQAATGGPWRIRLQVEARGWVAMRLVPG